MQDFFLRIAELKRAGRPFALATVVHSEDSTPRQAGARMIVHPDGSVEGSVGGGALEKRVAEDALRLLPSGSTGRFIYDLGKEEGGVPLGMICGGKVEVLIEAFKTGMKIFIFGAGHVGKKLSELCGALGITHWVIDNRAEYARPEAFPYAAGVVHAEFAASFAQLPIDKQSYIVIVTYGHLHDGACLEEALKTRARYIGMIGSRKKVKALFDSLKAKGIDVRDERIFSPIGLDIGDNTPEEIGISIISEIIKLKSGGTGRHIRDNNDEC